MKHDVVSIGNPLMDILIDVEEDFLKEINLVKGNMHLVDEKTIEEIEGKLDKNKIKLAPGGSEANTLTALAMLGHKVVYFGKVAEDAHGEQYHNKLVESGVISKVIKVGGVTGRAVTFITPDSERTFATHLGVAPELEDNEINEGDIMEARFLHLTAYILLSEKTRKAAMLALEIAKKNNVKVCFDVADPNVVKGNKDIIKSVIEDYADIVIANEEEAKAFTGQEAESAVETLSKLVGIAVVKIGREGSLIKEKDSIIRIPGFKANAVDTTGAGDIYAAGFLYGLLNDFSLDVCGKIASFIASKVVEVKGARLEKMPVDDINRIKNGD
ncbi:MAG: adenosine kinase [Nanoarchaeota archaeon]|nr:adenosine kinase [Nanoarchaeota archaeon]